MTRVAICVGQDIYAPDSGVPPLRGGVNDARLVGTLLARAGFVVRRLEGAAATQAGILGALRSAVAALGAGDRLVFWNASHGYQVADRSGDESGDRLDEAICCYDNDPADPLTDDRFAAVLGAAHPAAEIVFASDSCHSGTLTRLAVVDRDAQARLWVPPEHAVAPHPAVPVVRRFGRLATAPGSEHLLLSACRAAELSWGAPFPEGFHGAMTHAFATAVLAAWNAGTPITYRQAFDRATPMVSGRFDQHPVLEGPDRLKDRPVFGHLPAGPAASPAVAGDGVDELVRRVRRERDRDLRFAMRLSTDPLGALLGLGVPASSAVAVLSRLRPGTR